MSYSDGARGSNWADLDKSLEIRRTGDSVWLLIWREIILTLLLGIIELSN